jgi:hypothetical protein
MASYFRTTCRYADTTNDVPISTAHCTFWVTRARFEMRLRNRLVDRRASLPARSRLRIQTKNPTRISAPATMRTAISSRF